MAAASLLLAAPLIAQVILVNDPRAAPGYRLIAPIGENTAYLVDNSGRVVHEWVSDYPLTTVAYLLPNGNLLRTALMANKQILAGGGSGRIEELAWDGSVVWSCEHNDAANIVHHDVKRLPNGNYLMVAWERKPPAQALAAGIDPARLNNRGVLAERLIEVRPWAGGGGEVVWEWNLWDHLIQNHDPSKANYGDVASHPERVDLNYTADPTTPDLFHVNSVAYNPALDQIVLSVRNFSEVWILDHSTTTQEAKGDTGGRSGKGGGLIYRWGNPEAWGAVAGTQQLLWQHDAHWIEPGLPGEGRLLVFNNLDPGGGLFSSVVEFEPPLNPDGSYARLPGGGFGPEQPYWVYTAPEPEEFYSAFISGAQRLPNGNTLICSGGQGLIFEVTPEGETVWKYSAGLNANNRVRNVFRAYWYPADYDGLRGTPLWPAAAEFLHGAKAR